MRTTGWVVVWTLVLLGAAAGPPASAEEPLGLVDWLEARGEDSSFAARRARYETLYPGTRYEGTAEQNVTLLNALKEGVRKGAEPLVRRVGAPGPRTRQVVQLGWRLVLDRSSQVLRLSAPRDTVTSWLDDEKQPKQVEPALLPTPPTRIGFVSAAALGHKAKQFDDGLYAAVEGAVLRGLGAFPGTAVLLEELKKRLPIGPEASKEDAATVIHAASHLGRGWRPNRPGWALGAPVKELLVEFDADEKRSKPLGFYTWRDDLGWIFRQDRMLQTPLGSDASPDAVVRAMKEDGQAAKIYESWLELVEGFTNPFAYEDLRGLLRGEPSDRKTVYVLPPSRSHETELAKRLWGNRSVPPGANLMDLLVERIRDGKISLKPRSDSGWYDRQTWALEPLLRPESTPEAKRLRYDETYREYLETLFKALLALTRETHVKQVEFPNIGMAMPPPRVIVTPSLTVEPLATHYLRRAETYRFVRGVLEQAFGEGALRRLSRFTPSQPRPVNLDTELRFMERLFRGAAETAFRETGAPEARSDGEAAADLATFDAWRLQLERDPDLAEDARMMVPVFYDVERGKAKVWVFLGWSQKPLYVRYEELPTVVSRESLWPGARGKPDIDFQGQNVGSAYPVFAEVYVTKLLDREEFRAHCDRHRTRSAILANLR